MVRTASQSAPPLVVGLYLSAIIGGTIDIDPTNNELLIALDPEPAIYVEVVKIDDEGYQDTMTELFAGLLRILVPNLLSSALGSFPIPEFDLGGIEGVPSGTVLRITNTELDRPNDDYVRLRGQLR